MSRKIIAKVLSMVLLLNLFIPGLVYAEEGVVEFSLGDEGIPFTLSYEDVEEDLITNEEGMASSRSLFEKLTSLGWGGSAEVEGFEITLDVNHPDLSPKERALEGNPKYQGVSEQITLSPDEWTIVTIEVPLEEGRQGLLYYKNEDGSESPAVDVPYADGVTDEDGYFYTLEPLSIPGSEDYEGVEDNLENLDPDWRENKVYINERFSATEDMLNVEWVNGPSEKEVSAKEGCLISTSQEGPFSGAALVTMGEDGSVTPVYIEKDGKVSKPFNKSLSVDDIAPVVTSVDTASDTATLKSHGIYGKNEADLIITVTLKEEESGIKEVSLIGSSGTIYPLVSEEENELTYKVESLEELLKDTLYVKAEDNAGNVSEQVLIRTGESASTITLELTAPVITDLSTDKESVNGWFKELPQIRTTGSDPDAGLESIIIYIGDDIAREESFDDKKVEEAFLTADITEEMVPENGILVITAVYTDNSGNTTSETLEIKVDLEAPVINVSGVSEGDLLNAPREIGIEVSDNLSDVSGEVIVKRNSEEVYTESLFDIPVETFSEDGEYEILIFASDEAGNETNKSITFTIDSTAATIIDKGFDKEPNENGWYNDEVTLNFEITDEISGVESILGEINGSSVDASEGKLTLAKEMIGEGGSFTFKVTVKDNAGNESSLERVINVDTVAPEIEFSGLTSGSIYNKADDLEIRINEAHYNEEGAGFTVVVNKDGDLVKEISASKENSALLSDFTDDGEYEVIVNAYDAAGNTSEETFTFTVDKTAPEITNKGFDKEPNENGWYNSPVTFTYELEDALAGLDSVKAYVNGSEVATSDGKVAITEDMTPSEDDVYTVKIIASDNAGNESEIEDLAKIDMVKPSLTLSGVMDGENYNSSPSLEITSDEKHFAEASITVSIDRDGNIEEKTFDGVNAVTLDSFDGDGHYAVTVNSMDAAGNKAEEKSISFVIDKTAPDITGTGFDKAPNANGWYNSSVTYTYQVEDETAGIKSITATVNGTPVETSDGKVTITEDLIGEGGDFEIEITATDSAGNTSVEKASCKIDIVSPEVTLSNMDEYYKESPTLEISSNEKFFSEEGSKINVSIDRDGSLSEETYPGINSVSLSDFTKDGHYTVKVSSVDAAGNISQEKTVSFVVDGTAPVLNGDFERKPNGNDWYSGPLSFVYDATDVTSGISEIKAYINGTHVEEAVITEDLIRTLEKEGGAYTVKISVSDKAGNIAEIEKTAKIDIVKPVINLSNIEEGKNYQEAPNLNIDNNEKHFERSTVTVLVDRNGNSSEKVYEGVKNLSINEFEEDGVYTVSVKSIDAAGNKSDEKKITFTVDAKSPVITDKGTNVSPNSNGWFNGEVTFNFEPTDETSGIRDVKATVNGKPVEIRDNSVTITDSLINEAMNDYGTYTVEITATDKSGNEKTFAKTLKIDTVKPDLSFENVSEGAFYKDAPTVKLLSDEKHFSEADVSVLVERNGNKTFEKTYSGVRDVSLSEFPEDGKYRVVITSTDAAGNVSDKKEISFTKDDSPAVIRDSGTDKTPNGNGWFNSPVTVNFDISDETAGVRSINAYVNGRPVTYSNGQVSITDGLIRDLANDSGSFTVNVEVTDNSGNVSNIERAYRIDLDRPNLTLSGIDAGKHYREAPTLSVSSDDRYGKESGHVITVNVTRDGTSIYTESFSGEKSVSVSPFTGDGDYKITVSAVDAAGNASESKEISFSKDSTAPVISISGVEEGRYYSNPAQPQIAIDERYYSSASAELSLTKELNGVITSIPLDFVFSGETSVLQRSLSDTGLYTLKVNARDESGNVADQKSISFYVDTVAPKLTISGIESAVYNYEDVVAPFITYEDDYLDGMTFSITKKGENWKNNLSFNEEPGKLTFTDFSKVKINDGSYVLTVSVKDKAGNVSEETIPFTVNRFGSYFKYDKGVESINGKHVNSVNSDLVIYEYNVTPLKDSRKDIRLDGKSIEGATQSILGTEEDGYICTKHIFKKENFEKEGVYEINIISEDSSGNKMESQAENGIVKFIVDRTAPTIHISGLERYMNASNATAVIRVSDGLSLDNEVSVYVNGTLVDAVETENGLEVPIGVGNNQEIKVVARDAAGNETEEFFTVSVIPSGFMYTLTKNTGALAGGAGALSLAALLILLAKRRKKDEE